MTWIKYMLLKVLKVFSWIHLYYAVQLTFITGSLSCPFTQLLTVCRTCQQTRFPLSGSANVISDLWQRISNPSGRRGNTEDRQTLWDNLQTAKLHNHLCIMEAYISEQSIVEPYIICYWGLTVKNLNTLECKQHIVDKSWSALWLSRHLASW